MSVYRLYAHFTAIDEAEKIVKESRIEGGGVFQYFGFAVSLSHLIAKLGDHRPHCTQGRSIEPIMSTA